MNRAAMSQSLVTLKNYSADDKGMKVGSKINLLGVYEDEDVFFFWLFK